jgi:hypothetical protein
MRSDRSGAGDLAHTREMIEENRRSCANLADSNEIERSVPILCEENLSLHLCGEVEKSFD